jgi:hypothetical protein
MADALAVVKQQFEEAVDEEFHRDVNLFAVDPAVAAEIARHAARAVAGNLRWRLALGDSLTTTELVKWWEVTRQALNERLRSGELVGLKGKNTTHYPRWQFDDESGTTHRVRPVVENILKIFRSAGDLDHEAVVSWAASPQPELQGRTPRDVIDDPAFQSDLERAAAAAVREFNA